MVTKTKFMLAETKALDKQGRVHAVVSNETKDRDGDIIRAKGWKLANFKANPVLLSSHDYHSLQNVIGEWESMSVKGTDLVGVARYFVGDDDPLNPEAQAAHAIASRGKAVFSVGFIPDMKKATQLDSENPWGGFEFNGQELLEVSQVSVPSNPEARQILRSKSALHPVVKEFLESMDESSTPTVEHGHNVIKVDDLDEWMTERLEQILERYFKGQADMLVAALQPREPIFPTQSVQEVLEGLSW